MSADIIAKALGGGRIGSGWMACCPAHNDRNPSLSIQDADDGKVLVYCHAGCDQARVIAALQARGLEVNYRPHRRLIRSHSRCSAKDQLNRNHTSRTEAALRIWRSARPATGTLVEAYLRSRGISIALPLTVRFHAELRHPSGTIWPAMVTLVTRGTDDVPLAIHRTFLARGGEGKALIEPQKMMLGPCRGGAVRLALSGGVLMVGEGIETCLAAMQATGRPAWAALSTSGLRTLDLPGDVNELTVLADGDVAGEAAARDAAIRWSHKGRHVRIARPPQGFDLNDVLLGRISARVEGNHNVAA